MASDGHSPKTGDALLLRLFAAPDADHTALFAQLDVPGWDRLIQRLESERGEVLLRRALQRSGQVPPAAVAARLDAAVRSRTFTALRQAEALCRVARLLADAGMVPIALKGARLAWRTYPAPSLRPLRDLDLLLPVDEVERAQDLLLSHPDYVLHDAAGRYGVEHGHQLPEIVDRQADVMIELHHRLNARGWAQEGQLLDLIRRSSELLDLGGQSIRVPCAHGNLLHLVEHATLHHLFDNGPAVLADAHFIAASGEIDWPLLRSQAGEMGLDAALALIAALAARHGAGWPAQAGLGGAAAQVTAERLMAAESALLREQDERAQVALLRRLEVRTGAAVGPRAAVRAALRPGPAALAQIAGTRPDDPRRWLAYPTWLVRRIGTYHAASSAQLSGEASRQARLLEWLHGR